MITSVLQIENKLLSFLVGRSFDYIWFNFSKFVITVTNWKYSSTFYQFPKLVELVSFFVSVHFHFWLKSERCFSFLWQTWDTQVGIKARPYWKSTPPKDILKKPIKEFNGCAFWINRRHIIWSKWTRKKSN